MKYLVKFLFVIFIIALTTKMITNHRKYCNSIDSTRTFDIDSKQTIVVEHVDSVKNLQKNLYI